MARKNEYGKYVISAGEIATYCLCPEAWRLGVVKKVEHLEDAKVKEGHELHDRWNEDLDEAMVLSRGVRFILAMMILSTFVFLVKYIL